MISIQTFVFGPFQENTYILFDETKDCIIIDPGCYNDSERSQLASFIEDNKLKPVKLINTHCHLDHIFGNGFIADKYHLKLEINKHDKPTLDSYFSLRDIHLAVLLFITATKNLLLPVMYYFMEVSAAAIYPVATLKHLSAALKTNYFL